MPLVSVVIPTLRRPKLVLRALASVFNQTYSRSKSLSSSTDRTKTLRCSPDSKGSAPARDRQSPVIDCCGRA